MLENGTVKFENRKTLARQVNVGVHAMGDAVHTLCGCLDAGDTSVCAFKDVAPICTVPYESYVGVFGASSSLWDAVKAATEACTVIGAPALAPTVHGQGRGIAIA